MSNEGITLQFIVVLASRFSGLEFSSWSAKLQTRNPARRLLVFPRPTSHDLISVQCVIYHYVKWRYNAPTDGPPSRLSGLEFLAWSTKFQIRIPARRLWFSSLRVNNLLCHLHASTSTSTIYCVSVPNDESLTLQIMVLQGSRLSGSEFLAWSTHYYY